MYTQVRLYLVLLLSVAWLWVGCGTPTDTNNNNSNTNANSNGNGNENNNSTSNNNENTNTAPTLPTDLKEGWSMFDGGEGTVCSRGDKFSFFVRKGKVNKVIIDFIGGGACWDARSCSIADAIFSDSVEPLRKAFLAGGGYKKGIYDWERADNPFKDWYHITIPYCTGDIHWGNNVVTYTPDKGEPFKINHKGAVNARYVLDWVYKRFSKPEKILVTGCSAGAYGSILWSAHVAKQYPDSKVYQMGDCGAGIITDTFLKDSFPSWKAEEAMPTWIPTFDPSKVKITDHDLSYLYINIAGHYKNHLFSQYNTAFDENQTFYFKAMGGQGNEEWGAKMRDMMDKIHKDTPNFRTYIASGKKHCILVENRFYEVKVKGVKFMDWLYKLAEGEAVENITCEGDACKEPTVPSTKP